MQQGSGEQTGNSLVLNGAWKVCCWLEIAILFLMAVLYVRVITRHPVSNINSILLSSSLFGDESPSQLVDTFSRARVRIAPPLAGRALWGRLVNTK